MDPPYSVTTRCPSRSTMARFADIGKATPSLPQFHFEVSSYPLQYLLPYFIGDRIGDDANPAVAIAALLTDPFGKLALDITRLDIASFKPKNVVTKTQYTEWPIELGLEGSYHDLGRFFDRIATMPRLMSVSDLTIKTKARPNGRGSISVSCVATTFVFEKEELMAQGGQKQ